MEKRCNRCKKTKSTNKFYRDSNKKDGFRTICKVCGKKYYIEVRKRNNAKTNLFQGFKRCPKCRRDKPKTEFFKDFMRPDGFTTHCKVCHRGYQKNGTERLADYYIVNQLGGKSIPADIIILKRKQLTLTRMIRKIAQ